LTASANHAGRAWPSHHAVEVSWVPVGQDLAPVFERVRRIGPERRPPRRVRFLEPAEMAAAGCEQYVGNVAGRIVE